MDREKLDNHFRRCGSLKQSMTALLNCAIDLPDQGDGTSQALVGIVFLLEEYANELEHIEEVVLWMSALSKENPQAND